MPLVSTQKEIIELFPKFNDFQLDYFSKLIEFSQFQRLSLNPAAMEYQAYQIAYMQLVAEEAQLQWLIDTNEAVLKAEFEERVNNKPYDVESAFAEKQAQLKDLNVEQLL